MAKKPYMQLIDVDDLCLAAISEHFRCDQPAGHTTNCAHKHEDVNLCNFMDSFSEELTKQHRAVKTITQVEEKPEYPNHWGGMM